LNRHERSPAPEGPDPAELEAHIGRLEAALEREQRAVRHLERLQAATAALVGELDSPRLLEIAERWVTATLGRPCTVVRADGPTPATPAVRAGVGGTTTSCIGLPVGAEPVAWLCIGGDPLDPDEQKLADVLAGHVSRALDASLEVLGRDEAFRTLERSLLPDALLTPPGLQVASRYLPARGIHAVGGDFYDGVRHGDTITLIVGDVQGKGVEAATLTSLARHTLRAGAFADHHPAALLEHLNTALLYGQAEQLMAGLDPVLRFVTAAIARLEPAADGWHVRVARAGQPPPIIVRSAGRFEHLEPAGVLLGVTEHPVFEETTSTLAVGDTLLLYTDGVIEQRQSARAFSEQHLGMLVRNRRSVVDAEATAQLIEDTVHLVAPENIRDDVAILVACAVPPAR